MVKNREELLHVAQNNADQLKINLRRAINAFMKAQNVSPRELAYVLGISDGEMRQLIEGDGNITVNALSKLLVATDMVVEIKPVANTPLEAYGREMPHSGGFPGGHGIPFGPDGIPVGPDGRPLPPPPGCPRSPFENGSRVLWKKPAEPRRREERASSGPVRDEHGRFVKKTSTVRKPSVEQREEENPYNNLPDADLVNIIRQNIWDGEIDVDHASHEQLVRFVSEKERIMRQRQNADEQSQPRNEEVEQKAPKGVKGGGSALNQFLEMLGNVAREAENNPQLMETISRFMPR